MAAINMLAASGSIQEVEQLSIDASRYLRRNLRYNNQKQNTVAEEIRLAAEYIQLANVISAVPLEFTVSCPKELEDCLIPNLILQPLVENSIKHGIPPCMEDTFHIQLSVDTEDSGALVLTIADNGVGYRQAVITELEMLQKDERFQPRSAGFGTAGVIRRLALQYGDSYRFQIHNHENGGAVTTILIPKS
jgi:two-component system sensor histidine kinase YesM